MLTPTHLGKQPIIATTLQLTYSEQAQISETVPAFLFLKFERAYKIENLPGSQIPKNVREGDEKLHLAPISRIQLDNYILTFSDRGISIKIKNEYSGWINFKKIITDVIDKLTELDIEKYMDRVLLSYVNFFDNNEYSTEHILDLLNINISLNQENQNKNKIDLRIEKSENSITANIRILNKALARSKANDEFSVKGLILDITCSQEFNNDSMNFINILDNIHSANKKIFFDCLNIDTIESLNPVRSR